MMKYKYALLGATLLFIQSGLFAQNTDYTKFVNPFIGIGAVEMAAYEKPPMK